jgi:vacuolar-type H+-ATPase subunit D/Vma8
MLETLMKKKEELQKSLFNLEREYERIAEQIAMHKGAVQYNDMLIKEVEESSKDKPAE